MHRSVKRWVLSPGAPALAGDGSLDLDLPARYRSGAAAAAVLALLTILAVLPLGAGDRGPGAHQVLDSARHPIALPLTLAPRASSSIGAADARFWPVDRGGTLVARAAGMRAVFAAGAAGFQVGAGRLDLSLRRVGDLGRMRHLAGTVRPGERRNRILYRYGAISELYANGPFGIEQSFTVAKPQARAGTLRLDLSIGGSLSARQSGAAILFSGATGKTALRYGDLYAVDASGRRLGAHLRLQRGMLALDIDTQGARYPLEIDPFIQAGAKLKGAGGEELGYSVALSAEGNIALIGAPKDGEGAAFIFTRSGATWTQQGGALLASGSNGKTGGFGASVALSASGATALIGAPSTPGNAANAGAAFLFARSGPTWTETQVLTGAGELGAGAFGEAVALSADGSTALVGAPKERGAAAEHAGAVYIFVQSGSSWTQQTQLKLTGSESTEELEAGGFALLGSSVALSSEGNTALIGGPGFDLEQGAAFVFTRSGATWTQQGPRLTGAGAVGEAAFGGSTALSADGNTALIGGDQDRDHLGAAWVFTRSGTTWTQQGEKLSGAGESGVGAFGSSVSLSADGDTGLIGARLDGGSQGAAWVFTRAGSIWTQQGEKLTGAGEAGTASFGTSVALASNGASALVGGREDDGYAGGAWVFEAASSPVPSGASTTPTENPGSHRSHVRANASIAIERVKLGGRALLVTVKISSSGAVTISGDGLSKLVRTLGAGVHTLRVAFTRAGRTLRRQADTIKLSAGLRTAMKTSTRAKRDVKL